MLIKPARKQFLVNTTWLNYLTNGWGAVRLEGKRGYVYNTGEEVIPCKYDEIILHFVGGFAKVKLDGKWGYFDINGKEIIPCKYDEIDNFSGGLARVKLDGKFGYYDRTGKEIIPCKYDKIDDFSDELARVRLNDKWGYYDRTGKEIIPCKYDGVDRFFYGFAKVKLDDKWGYYDRTGNEVVPPKYDYIQSLGGGGMTKVALNAKCGYIDTDKSGKEVIQCKYDYIGSWKNGKAEVCLDGKVGEIDENGNETVPLKYENQQMQAIWENLYFPEIGLRLDIRPEATTDDFTIKRPYLLVSAYQVNGGGWDYKMKFSTYSENTNNFSVKNVKILIVQYNYPIFNKDYGYYGNQWRVYQYGSYLFYFDVVEKKCIGYDSLPAPDFPPSVQYGTTRILNSYEKVLKTIESRLTTSAKQNKVIWYSNTKRRDV